MPLTSRVRWTAVVSSRRTSTRLLFMFDVPVATKSARSPGRIHERDPREVDDHRRRVRGERTAQFLLEVRGRGHVQLPDRPHDHGVSGRLRPSAEAFAWTKAVCVAIAPPVSPPNNKGYEREGRWEVPFSDFGVTSLPRVGHDSISVSPWARM